MKCPVCQLENPSSAARCDCGYSFAGLKTNSDSYLRSIDASLRTIKQIIVWWAVLTVVGLIIWFVVTILSGPNERFQTPPTNKSIEAPAR
jgi:predicted metal-dependent RNase